MARAFLHCSVAIQMVYIDYLPKWGEFHSTWTAGRYLDASLPASPDSDTEVQSETKYAAVPQLLSLPSDKRTLVCDRRGQGGFDEYIRHDWIAAEG